MSLDYYPNVSVVIPNYNNKDLLEDLLVSLEGSIDFSRIIIVDNNSEDDSVHFIRTHYPEVRLIENNINRGFAAAVNQGITEVKTEYVFLLNNDTVVEKDTIKHLLDIINQSEDIFSVSSKMIQFFNRQLLDDAGDEYTIMGWSKRRGYDKPVRKYSRDEEVFSSCAGAALYRMSVFDKIGLFDEKFESYVEDMDISFRARLYGYKCFYSSKAVVYHHGSATTGSRYNSFKVRISARNNVYLIYKNMPTWMKILNGVFLLAGFLIKYIFFCRKNMGSEYKNGVLEGLRTRNILTKPEHPIRNSLKIEYLLIKNVFTFFR